MTGRLALVLALLLTALTTSPAHAARFTDVPDGHVFADEIDWLATNGITTGYADGSFRPAGPVLREQMAAFLYRFEHGGADPAATGDPTGFSDVAASRTFAEHVTWLAGTGVTTGYPDGTFQPTAPVLREQMAAFLYRLAGATATATSCGLRDVPRAHTFAKEICWLASTKITTGYTVPGGTEFRGSQPVLREQMAAFLVRYDERLGRPTTTAVLPTEAVAEPGVFASSAVMSGNGRFVAYASNATDGVAGPSDGVSDVFVTDRVTGKVELISTGPSGAPNPAASGNPSISSDGRYVAFDSYAGVHVRDRQTGLTKIASVSSEGVPANDYAVVTMISPDGRTVSFMSPADNLVPGDTPVLDGGHADVFVHDLTTGETTRVSASSSGVPGNGHSSGGRLSADGRFVTFGSSSTNLVPDDPAAGGYLYLHDRKTGTTEAVTHGYDGSPANFGASDTTGVSADGRYVAFSSEATNLVPGDTNGVADVFVLDRSTDVTTRISVAGDGRQSDTDAGFVTMTADGRFVSYFAATAVLVPGGSPGGHSYLYDRVLDRTTRVSLTWQGAPSNGGGLTSLSDDGRLVMFASTASDLVPGPRSGIDLYVRDRGPARR